MLGDKIVVPNLVEYLRYLGFRPGDRDCRSAGHRGYLIPCPFHNDVHPSMAVYEDGAWCFSGCGGKYYNLAYLASEVKRIPYGEALKELGAERLTSAEKIVDYCPQEMLSFCEPNPELYIKIFQERHARCSTDYPPEMVAWLERKKLLKQAKELDWRWHDGTVYRHWGKGIVIPYKDPIQGGRIVYERFRAWNAEQGKFDKVISPAGTTSQPYLSTFRPNKRQWLCEGCTDCASLYAMGESALGIPGATAKKVINTIIALLNDLKIDDIELVLCGDEDAAGSALNAYAQEVARKIAPRLHIRTYEHVLTENKADMNDEYVGSVLRLTKPLMEEKPKDDFDFSGYAKRLGRYLDDCEKRNICPWDDTGALNKHAITDWLSPFVESSMFSVEKARGAEVLLPKYCTSGRNRFVIQVEGGAKKGLYEATPEAIALGWQEEQRMESGAVRIMQVIKLSDLSDIEKLDFNE